MRAKEFKQLTEFYSFHTQSQILEIKKFSDEIWFLQTQWKKYWGEIEYLKIYPHYKFENSKIIEISAKIDHFIKEHKNNFLAEKTNLVFHGHIVENYRFVFKNENLLNPIEITDLIIFDRI